MASEPPAPRLVFAHLWSAPLLEEGPATKTAVDELDVIAERDTLEKILEEAPCTGWSWRSAVATETELQRMLSRANVLHFTGHGRQNGLLLEHSWDDDEYSDLGRARILTAEKLQVLAGGLAPGPADVSQNDSSEAPSPDFPPRPLFAFLSACHSEHLGHAFVDCGVRHVVAIDGREPVLDTASKLFARVLYDALFGGSTVREAFSQARNRVQSEHGSGQSNLAAVAASTPHKDAPLEEHEKFLLLPRDRAPDYHNRPLVPRPNNYPLQPPPAAVRAPSPAAGGSGLRFVDESSRRPTGFLPLPTGCFVGRAVDVCAVYRNLHHPSYRVCAVAGEVGNGKTEVCLKALQHSQLRSEVSAYMSVNLKEVATQAIAAATAAAAAASAAGVTSSESASAPTVDMAGHLARAILAAQAPHADASATLDARSPGDGGGVSSPRSPRSPEDLSALSAAEAIALFVERQGRRAAVLFLDGAEHMWAPRAAAIAVGVSGAGASAGVGAGTFGASFWSTGGLNGGAAGVSPGLEAAHKTAAVVRDLSQKCERLRILVSVAHGSSNKDMPWPGLLEVPHEQINVPRLGAHDTARVFMKWARRGLLPREYRHKGLFEGGLKEFTGSMQDLDAVALFAMHPIILRTRGHARTAVNATSLVTPIPTQGGRAEPELVDREAEFLAHVDACLSLLKDAGAAIVSALGLPLHDSSGRPSPPAPPAPGGCSPSASASAATTRNDGSPPGENWSRYQWWLGNIDRDTSKAMLRDLSIGHFLLRKSSRPGQWALDVNVANAGSTRSSSSSTSSSSSSSTRSSGSSGSGRSSATSSTFSSPRYLPLLVSRDPTTGRMALQRAKCDEIPLGGEEYANIRELVESNSAHLRFPVLRRS